MLRKNCNTPVVLQESRGTRGYEEAALACFDTDSTWNLHVDEKLRRGLPGGSARVKILGAPGAYEVDWWSPAPGEGWEPVERGEFDGVEEPDEVLHLAERRGRCCCAGDGYRRTRAGEYRCRHGANFDSSNESNSLMKQMTPPTASRKCTGTRMAIRGASSETSHN